MYVNSEGGRGEGGEGDCKSAREERQRHAVGSLLEGSS